MRLIRQARAALSPALRRLSARTAAAGARRPRLGRAVAVACVMYAAFVLTLWMLLRFAGDRWWPATLLMYGPRWVWATPLLLLVPCAAVFRRRAVWVPLALSVAVV